MTHWLGSFFLFWINLLSYNLYSVATTLPSGINCIHFLQMALQSAYKWKSQVYVKWNNLNFLNYQTKYSYPSPSWCVLYNAQHTTDKLIVFICLRQYAIIIIIAFLLFAWVQKIICKTYWSIYLLFPP